jgi:hypothetical protein
MKLRCHLTVRSLIRVIAGVAFMAAVMSGFSHSVGAKGPESATITGPGIDRPIELLDNANHDLVIQLMEQMGLWYDTSDPLPFGKPTGELGLSYSLTWINSGPPTNSVAERTIYQLIYLDAEQGPVIRTPPQEGLQGWGTGVIGWFTAPNELRDTLVKLGVPISTKPFSREAAHLEIAADTVLPKGEPARAS